MFEIDGSQKSGSGTLLRLSVAMAAILNQPLHVFNIRQSRPQPGLKHQHLEAVLTAAKLSGANVEEAVLGSRELWFAPQQIRGGCYEAEIETAGNIPMLLLAVLPICLFADGSVSLHVARGGTDTNNAPTINYVRYVFLPTLKRFGVDADISVQKYGYYPKGMGEATLKVKPNPGLKMVMLEDFGKLQKIRGLSVCTFLADRQVAERQAKAAIKHLSRYGYNADIQVVNDTSNSYQKGSSIVLWAETDSGLRIGADAIGQLHKTAEDVGCEAVDRLVAELSIRPTVDVFLADMLIPYMALARGESSILARVVTEHLEANIWLMEKMLDVKFTIQKLGNLNKIEKSS